MQQMLSKLALAVSWDRTQYNAEEKSENRRAISGNGVKRWRFVHVVVQLGYGRREINWRQYQSHRTGASCARTPTNQIH